MILLGDILNLCLDSVLWYFPGRTGWGMFDIGFWSCLRNLQNLSNLLSSWTSPKKTPINIVNWFFFPYISRTCDLMPTKDLILFNHAEKMYQHHTVIAYLQTSVWYTSQLVDRDKGKGPISQGYWLTVTPWNLFHSLPEIFFSIFYIFILFVHQKQWVKRSLKYAFKN